ncbi:DUF4843 domain-containing protein [Chitinophaga caseinilytica]|uniref:DUF4843 domain-containing protein n=1 Tax=Chitinophaga caseinilytica TaxID=2267521 RepID=A0ABZ2ZC61_9BACT
MKKLLVIISGTCLLFACKKSQVETYTDEAPAIYFTLTDYSYSFMSDLDSTSRTIFLPVKLSGSLHDQERSFSMEAVYDTNTTAKPEWYEIKPGYLPGNSVNGVVPIVLKRNATVDTSLVKLRLKLKPGSALDTMSNASVQVVWTGMIIQPVNWRWLRYYFGTPFSTGWYKFIVNATGRSTFPYDGTLSRTDPVTWWMTAGQIQAYALQVKEALQAYNAANPGSPLRHDDGQYKGELVSMP